MIQFTDEELLSLTQKEINNRINEAKSKLTLNFKVGDYFVNDNEIIHIIGIKNNLVHYRSMIIDDAVNLEDINDFPLPILGEDTLEILTMKENLKYYIKVSESFGKDIEEKLEQARLDLNNLYIKIKTVE